MLRGESVTRAIRERDCLCDLPLACRLVQVHLLIFSRDYLVLRNSLGDLPGGIRKELTNLALPAIVGQAIDPVAQLLETAYIGRLGKFPFLISYSNILGVSAQLDQF